MGEFVARVRAALRRSPDVDEQNICRRGDFGLIWKLDRYSSTVGGQTISEEFELPLYLIRNVGKVLTHEHYWQTSGAAISQEQTEYLRVFIRQLRKD
jgi:two-component system KDP operon response regulator KdpE